VLLAGLAAVVLLQAGRDWGSHPFREWSWLAWPAALGVHYYLLHRHEEDLGRAWAGVVHLAGVGLVVFLAAWEAAWGLDRLIGGGPVWRVAAWGLVPILAARGLMITGDRIPWPVVRFRMEYLSGGVGLLLAAAGWWLIVRGLFHEGKPDPLPYIVLLNPLDLTALFVWETGLAWYRNVRRGALPWPTQTPPLAPAAWTLLVLAFLLVNAFLARAIHFWAPVLWRPDALYRSMAFEAGLSMIWTLWALGMMIAATRYRIRPAWFVGLALLGLVVVKLFFVDLSHTGAILRIVSFMGVGVLMLVTAYFSPLPPKPKGGLAS
jgi:uncharacterized membrane protein